MFVTVNEKVQEAVRRFLRVGGLRNDGQCHLYNLLQRGVSLGGASGRHGTSTVARMYCPFGSSVSSSGR
jgi:hypothetical protein